MKKKKCTKRNRQISLKSGLRYLIYRVFETLMQFSCRYRVTVPPERMEIMDLATGRQLLRRQDDDNNENNGENQQGAESSTTTTVVGPYAEGSDVRVRCRVYGGQYTSVIRVRIASRYKFVKGMGPCGGMPRRALKSEAFQTKRPRNDNTGGLLFRVGHRMIAIVFYVNQVPNMIKRKSYHEFKSMHSKKQRFRTQPVFFFTYGSW